MERMLHLLSRRLGDHNAGAVRAGGVRGTVAGALLTSGLLALPVVAGTARGASGDFTWSGQGARAVTRNRLTIQIESRTEGERIAGRLRDGCGQEHQFSGWLGLLTLLERAWREADAGRPDATEGSRCQWSPRL